METSTAAGSTLPVDSEPVEVTPTMASTPSIEPASAPQSAEPLAATVSFGPALVAAREAQGISVAEMAGRLRLQVRQLEALEKEHLDELPSAPFVRGYLRSYAKELRIDPAPLLVALGERLPAPGTLGLAPPSGPVMIEVGRVGVERASRLMVIGGTVVALLILAVVGWIASTRLKSGALAKGSASVPAAVDLVREPVATPSISPSTVSEPVAAVTGPVDATALGGLTPGVSTAVQGAAEAAAPSVTGARPASGSSDHGLRLQVSGRPSWVEVTDADGRVAFVGTLSGGAEQLLSNVKAPLRLVIGNASTVTVTYRGRLVDLQPHIRANDLARLTLE